MADSAGKGVGVPQITVRPLHLTQLHKPPDIGGADSDAAQFHLGNDIAAQAQLRTGLHQQLR